MKTIVKFFKYLLVAVFIAVFLLLITLASSFKDIKLTAQSALAGKSLVEEAVNLATNKEFADAKQKTSQADIEINNSLNSLENIKSKFLFSRINFFNKQLLDLEYLLKTVSLINKSLDEALPLARQFNDLYTKDSTSFSDLPVTEKQEFFRLIYESEPEINGLRANLELARLNLNKIRKIGILYPIYNDISNLKSELDAASKLLTKATPLTRLLPALAGYPSKSEFLVIMHNNDELRPSGGFIGVFGLLEVENGEISHLKTYDSYHLDMPAVGAWKMTPPEPISKYMQVENWYLRDANWSPDWPTSARKIEEIYIGESKATNQEAPDFTGVIGITPDFVSDLLALVGPIEAGGEVYTPENLQPLLQYSVEVSYKEQEISSWDRKQVINDLLEELKNRLLKLETNQLLNLLNIFEQNSLTKDLQIYFDNSLWQSLVQDLEASGEVIKTDNDYLLVVDANLAAFKSDAVVRKGIKYQVNTQILESALKLNYKHEGTFDWRTTRYRSYTRVYVPRGAKLNSIKAGGQINLEEASILSYDDTSLDKTVFAFFFTLEPQTEGYIDLNYTLPNFINYNNYILNIQKQAGRRTDNLEILINNTPYSRYLDRDLIIKP